MLQCHEQNLNRVAINACDAHEMGLCIGMGHSTGC